MCLLQLLVDREPPELNLLSLEALAAAEYLDADLCLAETDENPPLREAAARRGVAVRIIAS